MMMFPPSKSVSKFSIQSSKSCFSDGGPAVLWNSGGRTENWKENSWILGRGGRSEQEGVFWDAPNLPSSNLGPGTQVCFRVWNAVASDCQQLHSKADSRDTMANEHTPHSDMGLPPSLKGTQHHSTQMPRRLGGQDCLTYRLHWVHAKVPCGHKAATGLFLSILLLVASGNLILIQQICSQTTQKYF